MICTKLIFVTSEWFNIWRLYGVVGIGAAKCTIVCCKQQFGDHNSQCEARSNIESLEQGHAFHDIMTNQLNMLFIIDANGRWYAHWYIIWYIFQSCGVIYYVIIFAWWLYKYQVLLPYIISLSPNKILLFKINLIRGHYGRLIRSIT